MEIHGLLIYSGEAMIRLIYLLAVTMAIIIGNVLVIVAVGKFKKLRRTTNIMLASLAVADLLVGLITVPLYIAWTMHPEDFDKSPFLCRAALLSSLLVVASSQLNLLLLSVERFLAVCAPFKHRALIVSYPWLHVAVICLTWVVSLGTTGLASLAIKSDYVMCNYYKAFNRWFLFFAVIFGVFIPFIAIIFMNIKVFLRVLKHEKRRKSFISDYSDSVRLVSDSSDQEIRVPLLKQSTQIGELGRPSTKKSWVNRFFTSRNQCVRTRNESKKEDDKADDEVFFTEPQRTSISNCPDLGVSASESHTINLHENGSHNREDDVSDIYCENRLRFVHQDFTCPESNVQYHFESKGNGTFINLLKSKETSNPIKGSYACTSAYKAAQLTKMNDNCKSDPNITDLSLESQLNSIYFTSGFQINTSSNDTLDDSLDESRISSCYNISNQERQELFKVRIKECACEFNQFPFNQQLIKDIEIFATPRFSRKVQQSTQAIQSYQAASASTKVLYDRPNLNCEDFAPVDSRENCHLNSTTLQKKQIENEEENIKNENEKWKTSQNSNMLSVSYSRSCNSSENDLTSKASGINHILHIPFTKMLNESSHGHWQDGLNGHDKMTATACSSDGGLIATCVQPDQVYLHRSVSHPSFFRQTSDTTKNSGMLNVSVTPPILSGAFCPKRPTSPSATYFENNKLSTRTLFRGQSTPILNSQKSEESRAQGIDEPLQSHFSEQLPLVTVNSFDFRATQTPCSQERRARLVTISPDDRSTRKISSGRESTSHCTAYVSKKVARTVALVCFSFILAWLPFFAVIIINTFCAKCNLVYFLNAVLMITFAQSASNPIIYALCHESFRTAYKNLFSQMCLKLRLIKRLSLNDIGVQT